MQDDASCINTLYFPASVITRFVSESGADTDGCGETAKAACRTMHPVFTQLLNQPTNVPPDLIRRIDEVWAEAIDEVGNFSNPDSRSHNETVFEFYIKSSRLDEVMFNLSRLVMAAGGTKGNSQKDTNEA